MRLSSLAIASFEQTVMEAQLKHGDQARIAEITGFTHDYVKKVIQGRRKNKKITAIARQIVADRARLAQQNKAA